MAVVAFSFGAALCFGAGGVLQKKGISSMQIDKTQQEVIPLILNRIRALLLNPIWVLGGILSILGWFLYFNALTLGDYLFVRPLVNSSLILGVIGGVLLLHENVTKVELGALGGIGLGAIILGFQEPGVRTITVNPFLLSLTLILLVISIIAIQLGFWFKTRQLLSEIPLAIIAGVVYGLGEIFTNLLAIQSLDTPNATSTIFGQLFFFFSSITFVMIVLTEIGGFTLKQLSFVVGRACVVIPISSSLSIVLPICAAIIVFGEPLILLTGLTIEWLALLRPLGIFIIIISVILLQTTRYRKKSPSETIDQECGDN